MKIKNVHGNTLDLLGEAIVAGHYAAGRVAAARAAAVRGARRQPHGGARGGEVAGRQAACCVTGPKVGTRVQPTKTGTGSTPIVVAWQSKAGLTREFLRDLHELRARRRAGRRAPGRAARHRGTTSPRSKLAFAGMKHAVGARRRLRDARPALSPGLLRASHNRMIDADEQGARRVLRVSFELSTLQPDARRQRRCRSTARCSTR